MFCRDLLTGCLLSPLCPQQAQPRRFRCAAQAPQPQLSCPVVFLQTQTSRSDSTSSSVVDADYVLDPAGRRAGRDTSQPSNSAQAGQALSQQAARGQQRGRRDWAPSTLRIKISGSDGATKLETKIPANFLQGGC